MAFVTASIQIPSDSAQVHGAPGMGSVFDAARNEFAYLWGNIPPGVVRFLFNPATRSLPAFPQGVVVDQGSVMLWGVFQVLWWDVSGVQQRDLGSRDLNGFVSLNVHYPDPITVIEQNSTTIDNSTTTTHVQQTTIGTLNVVDELNLLSVSLDLDADLSVDSDLSVESNVTGPTLTEIDNSQTSADNSQTSTTTNNAAPADSIPGVELPLIGDDLDQGDALPEQPGPAPTIRLLTRGMLRVTLESVSAGLPSDLWLREPEYKLIVRNTLKGSDHAVVGKVVNLPQPYDPNTLPVFGLKTYGNAWGLGTWEHRSDDPEFCRVEQLDEWTWRVAFEDLERDRADWDYDDAVFLVELIERPYGPGDGPYTPPSRAAGAGFLSGVAAGLGLLL